MGLKSYIFSIILILGGLMDILINPGKYEAGLAGGFMLGGGVALAFVVWLRRW